MFTTNVEKPKGFVVSGKQHHLNAFLTDLRELGYKMDNDTVASNVEFIQSNQPRPANLQVSKTFRSFAI